MKKNLVLIAPPAAGKGTMSTLLTEKYGMISISVGQLLRDIDPETELGKEIRELQANRMLVGNDIVKELLKERLSRLIFSRGSILATLFSQVNCFKSSSLFAPAIIV